MPVQKEELKTLDNIIPFVPRLFPIAGNFSTSLREQFGESVIAEFDNSGQADRFPLKLKANTNDSALLVCFDQFGRVRKSLMNNEEITELDAVMKWVDAAYG